MPGSWLTVYMGSTFHLRKDALGKRPAVQAWDTYWGRQFWDPKCRAVSRGTGLQGGKFLVTMGSGVVRRGPGRGPLKNEAPLSLYCL